MIKKKKITKDNVVKFPSKLTDLEKEIEAVIFAAAEPLDVDTIESKISKKANVAKLLEKLQHEYSNRGINLVCIKEKWSFRTSPKVSRVMTQEKIIEKKLSRAAIETLAIIVYHQPVTRAEIEEIRGVAFGTNTLEILMELNWVKPGGRKDVPGKPIQYLTTDGFLSHFNLQKLSDLPTVDELGAAGLIDNTSVDNAIFGSSKFFKEKQDEKKEDIYSNIDEMLNSTLDEEEKDS
ncbi:SMC-Scp complex subunit ScpB [Candidatus Pelagibacter sp.]|nr:SMC-Scp complex subunit ScpB [Candidatus Pelagibacter sp.]